MTDTVEGEIIADKTGKDETLYALSALFDVPMDLLVVGSRERELKEIVTKCNSRLFAYYIKFSKLVA